MEVIPVNSLTIKSLYRNYNVYFNSNFKDLTENGFLDFYAEDFEGSQIILKNLVGEITLLSLDAIREMKATLNDLRNDSVDLSAEESRFSYGFKTGIVAQRLKTYKNL